MNRLAAASFGSWGTPGGCLTGENQHAWYQMYSYHPAGVVTSKQLAVYGGSSVTASYTYDTYPMAIGGATQSDTFTSTFDGMGRPVTLTGSESPSPLTWVQNVQYDFAGRLSSLQYLAGTGYTTEAKSFNANGQVTSMAWSGSGTPVAGTLQYGYSATQNNGQITQVVDSVSGETIVYQYDSLKRLTSAASVPNTGSPVAAWTQTFQYDGFGNQTAQVLNGTTTAIPVDPTTNRLSGASYDANGNMTSGVGATFTFDVANRVLSAAEVSGGVEYYGYAPDNRRIYKKLTSGAEEYTFYGGQGEKLGVYNLTGSTMSALRTDVWFAGKLISENSSAVFQDRMGTNRASGARFHPYGDEITSTSNDRQKFATYTRDSYTGVDYADQRYYASAYGRYGTPDPYMPSAGPSEPGSWNRYSYVGGDPINRKDPRGLLYGDCPIDDPSCDLCVGENCICPNPNVVGLNSSAFCVDPSPPGPPGGPPLVLYATQAHAALNYEIKNLTPNCQKVLPSSAQLLNGASNLTFWDSRGAQGGILVTTLGDVPVLTDGNGNVNYNETLAQAAAGHLAVTLNGQNGAISADVVLGIDFFNKGPSTQGIVLLHELLHYSTQMGDMAFDTKYGIAGRTGDTWSSALSAWLANDCSNPK